MSSDYMPPSPESPGGYDPSRPLGSPQPSPYGGETYAPPPVDAPPTYSPPPPAYAPPAGGYAAPQPYYGSYAPAAGPMPAGNSGYAIASLVLSILGLVAVLPLIGSILGIIFGHLSLNEIKNSNGQLEGRGMAIAGLVIGYGALALGLLLICAIIAIALISSSATPTQ
ncbi:MAG TPA: DUF4190 domain-containing protein [Ktedonobacterales bacterium]